MDLFVMRIVLVLVGLLPMGVVWLKMRGNRRLLREGIRTHGVVRYVHGSSHSALNAIDLEYTTQSGMRFHKRLSVAGLPYAVGAQLPLIYDPTDPSRMMLGWKHNYTWIFLLTGLIAIAFASFALRLDSL